MKNTQSTSPIFNSVDGYLQVHSVYQSIQGEGPFVGQVATFVRLNGCNLQCAMCDTDYTSINLKVHPDYVIDKVLADSPRARHLVVITGGEPFRQNIAPVIRKLLGKGLRVQIETNGTLYNPDIPYDEVTVVCSPKTSRLHGMLTPHIDAYKYVIDADHVGFDGLPVQVLGLRTTKAVARPPKGFKGPIYVQPVDTGSHIDDARHLAAAVRTTMQHGYTLGIQLHKILNME